MQSSGIFDYTGRIDVLAGTFTGHRTGSCAALAA
jgi:hypothetical protein